MARRQGYIIMGLKTILSARPEGRIANNSFAPVENRGSSDRRTENEERPRGDQRKADDVVPGDRLVEVDDRKSGEHRERDHFLNGLELGGRVHRAAPTIG